MRTLTDLHMRMFEGVICDLGELQHHIFCNLHHLPAGISKSTNASRCFQSKIFIAMLPRLALLIFEVGVPQACTVAARNPSSATTSRSFIMINEFIVLNDFKDRISQTSCFSPGVTIRSLALPPPLLWLNILRMFRQGKFLFTRATNCTPRAANLLF